MKDSVIKGFGMGRHMLFNMRRKPKVRTTIYLKFGRVVTECEEYLCPKCGSVLNAGPNYQPKHCEQCGRRISFGGIEWKAEREMGFAERRADDEPV